MKQKIGAMFTAADGRAFCIAIKLTESKESILERANAYNDRIIAALPHWGFRRGRPDDRITNTVCYIDIL